MRAKAALVVLLGAAATVLPTAGGGGSAAVQALPGGTVTGWVANWDVPEGNAAMDMSGGLMNEVMPFWYATTGATTIAPQAAVDDPNSTNDLAAVAANARRHGMKVLPTITDGTGRLVLSAILNDPVARSQHVQSIAALVRNGVGGVAFDGIDIDYEGFAFSDGRASWPATAPGWLAFVRELGAALHAEGKLLSITVPAVWNEDANKVWEDNAGYWVYGNWGELVTHADRLRIMVYDWGYSRPDGIAPLWWVDDVIEVVEHHVPPALQSRVWLGVPAYGRSWATPIQGECPDNADTRTRSVFMRDAAGLPAGSTLAAVDQFGRPLGERYHTWTRSFTGTKTTSAPAPPYAPPATRAARIEAPADPTALATARRLGSITRTVSCTVKREVYVPDATSVRQRADRALAAGLGGITIWALGYETADMWPLLRG